MSTLYRPGTLVRRLSWGAGKVLSVAECGKFGLRGQLYVNGRPEGSPQAFYSFTPSDVDDEHQAFVPAELVPGTMMRLAVTVEVLVPAFAPSEVLHPGSAYREPDGSQDCIPPYTALDRFEEAMHDGVRNALENWTPSPTADHEWPWIEPGSLRARVVETIPAPPGGSPDGF